MPEYELKRSARARGVRITVLVGGKVVVTAPLGMAVSFVERFLAQKAAWIAKAVARQSKHVASVLPRATRSHYLAHKEAARSLVQERIAVLNAAYGFRFTRVAIRNQRRLWGSCSKSGGLNFNYRVLFLPPELADYIIVHELCHLKEMNHSARFWELVSRAIPNPKHIRKQFRARGFTLG